MFILKKLLKLMSSLGKPLSFRISSSIICFSFNALSNISIAIRSINSIPDAFKRNPDTFLSSLEKKPSKFCITILGTQ